MKTTIFVNIRRWPLILLSSLLMVSSCQKNETEEITDDSPDASNYYVLDVLSRPGPGKKLLSVNSYQQTTEYTCGPASVISLLQYYGLHGDEMSIASEMGTSTTTGTTPAQMAGWLNTHGFIASWHQNGTLELLRNNLESGIPTLVEWSDWGGHWVLVIGYDTRNTAVQTDDVIIFADPYDHHDDHQDGITWFNAGRFYYMWYDALLFGSVMTRVYIDADPR